MVCILITTDFKCFNSDSAKGAASYVSFYISLKPLISATSSLARGNKVALNL